MPHSETHTLILPHAIAYNAPYCPKVIETIHDQVLKLPTEVSLAQAIWDLGKENGAKMSLKEFGFEQEDLEKAAEIACKAA